MNCDEFLAAHNAKCKTKEPNGAFNIPAHITIFDHRGRDITPDNYNQPII